MKWSEMQEQIQRQRSEIEAVIGADPEFLKLREVLEIRFGKVELTYLAVPGPVRGQPRWLVGGPLSDMAAQGQLSLDREPQFVERFDRESWGFGPTPAQLREQAALDPRVKGKRR